MVKTEKGILPRWILLYRVDKALLGVVTGGQDGALVVVGIMYPVKCLFQLSLIILVVCL